MIGVVNKNSIKIKGVFGAVQKLRDAKFGYFCPPPLYVTKRNVSLYPPVLRNVTNLELPSPEI